MNRIYHRLNPDVDLLARDFANAFIVRKFCGSANISLYATLRVTGHDQQSSFIAAFGSTFFGHPDAIALAAKRFERTPLYRNAANDAVEALGAERIATELAARCEEASHFTQSHAMQFRVEMSQKWLGDPTHESVARHTARDEKSYADFAENRRSQRDKEARADRIGNGTGGQ